MSHGGRIDNNKTKHERVFYSTLPLPLPFPRSLSTALLMRFLLLTELLSLGTGWIRTKINDAKRERFWGGYSLHAISNTLE